MKKQRNYDRKVKNTRILLSDWLVLKRISQVAGVSMAEALHRLIEHQQQLPLMDMALKPVIMSPRTQLRMTPVTTSIAVNGHKVAAVANKPKGVRYG